MGSLTKQLWTPKGVLDLLSKKHSEKESDLLGTDFRRDGETETDTVARWPTASWELSKEIERKPPESCRPVTPHLSF